MRSIVLARLFVVFTLNLEPLTLSRSVVTLKSITFKRRDWYFGNWLGVQVQKDLSYFGEWASFRLHVKSGKKAIKLKKEAI
jgi:hypothetical protein